MQLSFIGRPLKFGVSFSSEDDLETRLKILYLKCGDLCDTNKQIFEGDFLGSVSSKVRIIITCCSLTPPLYIVSQNVTLTTVLTISGQP